MTGEEVRKMKDDEIKAELGRLRTKLFDLRSQTVTEKVENTAQFTVIRRDVARLLTESNSRRRAKSGAGGGAKGAKVAKSGK
ncbi:MAG: 50S ribosomal protein L29 [Phycisphaerales bacterium]|nr:50S ribosomal protein L29 [Phycisphaerales bacterium]